MRRRAFAALFGLGLLFAGAGSGALAQAPAEEASTRTGTDAANAPPAGFVPIKGKNRAAQTPAGPLVVAAYAAVLAGLFLYVIYVQRTQADLASRIEELRRHRDS